MGCARRLAARAVPRQPVMREADVAARSDAGLRWHRTTIVGRTVAYGDAGDGPAVVFLHGWGLTARSYAQAFPLIAATG